MSSVNRHPVPPYLNIRVFGPFQILLEGRPLETRTPKDLKALAYLLLHHNTSVGRAELAAACWPAGKSGEPIGPADASRLLSRAISELGRCLEEERWRLKKPTTQSLLFDTAGIDLDLLEWEAVLRDGTAEQLAEARMWRERPLLADWNDPWVLLARERMKADYRNALQAATLRARDQGDWEAALCGYALLVELDPLDANLVRAWWELLFERRRFTEMRRVYTEFLERSSREGRPVDPELRESFRRMREAAAQFEAGINAGWLPTPVSGFVARPADVAAIEGLVRSYRLTTLAGPGGIGKTRLSLAVGEAMREQFFDRVWFVDLAAVEEPALIAQQIARTLLLKEVPGKTPLETVCAALRAKETLLVLDNCEHLLEAGAQTAGAVLASCPAVKILATSREPLGIVGEAVWRVPCLDVPEETTPLLPEALERFGAVQLLVARATQPQTPFLLRAENARAVATICRLLDGIPLALELAAIQIHRSFRSAQEVRESLERRLRFLTAGSTIAPPRHQTLRATISWSYDLLTEMERRLFAHLAVFTGSFTLSALERICDDIVPETLSETLRRLVDKSLVEVRIAHQRERYHLLQTIQEYALEQWTSPFAQQMDSSEPEELARLRQRHLDYYREFSAIPETELQGPGQVAWFDLLEDEHENIRAALRWALEHKRYEAGLTLASSMAWFWYTRDRKGEGARWLALFLEVTPDTPTPLRLKAIHWAGNIAYGQSDFARALTYFAEGLEIRRSYGAPISIAVGQASLAGALGGLGDRHGALTLLEENLAVFREHGQTRNAALTMMNMGILAYELEDYPRACTLHTESLHLFQEIQDQEHIAQATNNLVGALFMANDIEAAEALLPESLRLCRELGSDYRLAICLINYATRACHRGEWHRAALILGYERTLRERIDYVLTGTAEEKYLQDCVLVQKHLQEARFQELLAQGARMSEEALVEMLLESSPSSSEPATGLTFGRQNTTL